MDETVQIDSKTYILSSSSRIDNRTRVLKKDDTVAVLDWYGEIGPVSTGSLGLYHHGTRYVSKWGVTLANCRPMPLNSTIREDNSVLLVDSTTPDILNEHAPELTKGTLHLRRQIVVEAGVFTEKATITNYSERTVDVEFAYDFATDFVDIFEVRGNARAQRGTLRPPQIEGNSVRLSYEGLDEIVRRTQFKFDRTPQSIDAERALFRLQIESNREITFTTRIVCESEVQNFDLQPAVWMTQKAGSADVGWAHIVTDNEEFNEWIERSIADLRMLTSQTTCGAYPYAGVPWFATPFGRDGLITALQTLWVQPSLSRGVLSFLAATQATTIDPKTESQPGKILHECREGEMANLDEIPFRRYYGTVDATPLYVVLAGRYYLRTHDLEFIRNIWPNVIRCIEWMEKYGDIDGDGFLEYAPTPGKGLVQQGWKDSSNSIFHADGSNAKAPIALCEVQAYAFDAYVLASKLAEALGEPELAQQWCATSERLREQFDQAFWDEELGTYVMALDADKNPCRVRSSNAGHALFSGIVKPERARQLAASLSSVNAFNGWGLRTVYQGEARYNPMSYHNGSVWPHDTAMTAHGLARYGFRNEAMLYLTGLYDAAGYWELSRLPELFCGFTRLQGQAPTDYPVACMPQAWASGSVFCLLQAVLGLDFTDQRQILFRKPMLPPFINHLKITNLQHGDDTIDLVLRRRGEDVAMHAENRVGSVAVLVHV